jgi:hypothetical protein
MKVERRKLLSLVPLPDGGNGLTSAKRTCNIKAILMIEMTDSQRSYKSVQAHIDFIFL